MIKLADGTLVLRRLLQKFCSVDFIGLPFFMTVMNFVKLDIDAKVWKYIEKKHDASQSDSDC